MLALLLALYAFIFGMQQPSALVEAAQRRADEQAIAGQLWHDLSQYPPGCGVGEILSRGYSPIEAFREWLESPPHAHVVEVVEWDHIAVAGSGDVLVVVFHLAC